MACVLELYWVGVHISPSVGDNAQMGIRWICRNALQGDVATDNYERTLDVFCNINTYYYKGNCGLTLTISRGTVDWEGSVETYMILLVYYCMGATDYRKVFFYEHDFYKLEQVLSLTQDCTTTPPTLIFETKILISIFSILHLFRQMSNLNAIR